MDFTSMPKTQGFSYLLVFVNTCTGWIEVFPTRTQRATEVYKALLKEIVPRFGLPQSLQRNNGPSFIAMISQNLATGFSSVQFSRSAVSNSLQLHESQHARPPCSSPTPGVHSDSHPSSQ